MDSQQIGLIPVICSHSSACNKITVRQLSNKWIELKTIIADTWTPSPSFSFGGKLRVVTWGFSCHVVSQPFNKTVESNQITVYSMHVLLWKIYIELLINRRAYTWFIDLQLIKRNNIRSRRLYVIYLICRNNLRWIVI